MSQRRDWLGPLDQEDDDDDDADPSCLLCSGNGGWLDAQGRWVICDDCFPDDEEEA